MFQSSQPENEISNKVSIVGDKTNDATATILDFDSHSGSKATNIAELIQEIADKDAEIIRLRNLLDAKDTVKTKPPRHYSWIQFINAGTARVNKSKGFQQLFLEATAGVYNGGDLSTWRRLDLVPALAMSYIANLQPTTEIGRGQDWTAGERKILETLLVENPKIKMADLADLVSQKFGRHITEGAVKAAKHRYKKSLK